MQKKKGPHLMEARSSWLFFPALNFLMAMLSQGFRKVFARFSRGFRKVFARFSRGFCFENIFVMVRAGRDKNQFLRAAGAPARGAAEPGPPRHAKIGKNHPNQSVRPPKKKLCFCFSVVPCLWYLLFQSDWLGLLRLSFQLWTMVR